MQNLIKGCKLIAPYFIGSFITIKLDNAIDVAPYSLAIYIPMAICLMIIVLPWIIKKA